MNPAVDLQQALPVEAGAADVTDVTLAVGLVVLEGVVGAGGAVVEGLQAEAALEGLVGHVGDEVVLQPLHGLLADGARSAVASLVLHSHSKDTTILQFLRLVHVRSQPGLCTCT